MLIEHGEARGEFLALGVGVLRGWVGNLEWLQDGACPRDLRFTQRWYRGLSGPPTEGTVLSADPPEMKLRLQTSALPFHHSIIHHVRDR